MEDDDDDVDDNGVADDDGDDDAVISELADEVVRLEAALARCTRYSQTLKRHLKAASAKNTKLRAEIADTTVALAALKAEYRKFQYETGTASNDRLRRQRDCAVATAEALQQKVTAQRADIENKGTALNRAKAQRTQARNDLERSHDRIRALRAIAGPGPQRTAARGNCVICLDDPAVMAVMPCGCLCYCQTCTIVPQGCPLCRRASHHVTRIYNLPA